MNRDTRYDLESAGDADWKEEQVVTVRCAHADCPEVEWSWTGPLKHERHVWRGHLELHHPHLLPVLEARVRKMPKMVVPREPEHELLRRLDLIRVAA